MTLSDALEYGAADTDYRYSPAACQPSPLRALQPLLLPRDPLRQRKGNVTPATAAGIETHPWSITQLCELLED